MAKRAPRVLDVRLRHEVEETSPALAIVRADRARFHEVESAIRRAREDAKISGLWIAIEQLDLGWSKAQSLYRAIRSFRSTGKPTVAFLAGAGNAAFLMASACETLVLQPSSTLHLESLSSDSFFFKDLLGDLGVSPEIDHVGEFKSAGEAFLRRESSEEHRRELEAILSDLQEQFLTAVADGRGMSRQAAARAIAHGPFLPDEAIAFGLVDRVEPEDVWESIFEERLGAAPRLVPHRSYAARPGFLGRLWTWRRPRVVVVHACGVITSGEGRRAPGSLAVGARSFVELLRKARTSSRVRAVVVRVDSPGGSAVASDVIRRELALTSKEKPVVISMGDVAASGGYYIATAADALVAEEATLTGSIGVIGGKVVVKRLLDRIGIHRESHSMGANAGFFSPFRAFTEDERGWHRKYLRHFYEKRFLAAVAEGRRLTYEQADAAGRGRVWTGRRGRELGLVDAIGGLEDAVSLAHDKANLPRRRSRVVYWAHRARLRELLVSGVTAWSLSSLGVWADMFALAQELAREELLLLMPRTFRIR